MRQALPSSIGLVVAGSDVNRPDANRHIQCDAGAGRYPEKRLVRAFVVAGNPLDRIGGKNAEHPITIETVFEGENMKRSLVLGIVIGGGLLAITVMGQQQPAGGMGAGGGFGTVDSIEKVADNLYRIPGGGGNSAVFVRADGVLLVDTKVPNNGQTLLDLIKKVTEKPVTHIVNTHTHGDHTGSNSFFPASVEVVAHEKTQANMQKMDDFKSATGKVGLPDRTYKDRMTLFSGKDAVDLYHFGPAHTNGDSFVVFRNARVMHAGDVFAQKGLPYIDATNGGSGVAYGDTIAKVAAGIKNVDKVMTGHGAVMNWQDFVDYGEFNRVFLEYVRTALAANKSAEQAMREFKLPAKFSGYNLAVTGPTTPTANVTTIYAELRK